MTISVEDLPAERGLDLLRRRRTRPTARWRRDEMGARISGRRFWLWRTVNWR